MDRGEKIDVLVDKGDELQSQATKFQKQAKATHTELWWQLLRMKLLVVFAILLAALLIFCFVCFSGGNCLKRKE